MATKRRKSVRRRSVRRRRHLGQLAPVAPQPQYIVEESSGSGMIILGLGALAILGIGAVLLLRRAPATATTTSGGGSSGSSNDPSLDPDDIVLNDNSPVKVSIKNGKLNNYPRHTTNALKFTYPNLKEFTVARTANSSSGSNNYEFELVSDSGGGLVVTKTLKVTVP